MYASLHLIAYQISTKARRARFDCFMDGFIICAPISTKARTSKLRNTYGTREYIWNLCYGRLLTGRSDDTIVVFLRSNMWIRCYLHSNR